MDAFRLGSVGTQYFNDNGDPLAGGKLYFYETGTTTEATTYSDEALTTANANPVVLDAAGRQPSIFYDGDLKVVLKDADDVTIETRDPVGCCAEASAGGGGSPLWTFDTTVRTSAFTAEAGKYYFVDTTSSAIAITMPASPTAGDLVAFRVVAGSNTAYLSTSADVEADGTAGSYFASLPTGSAPVDEQPYAGVVYLNETYGWVVFMGALEKEVG